MVEHSGLSFQSLCSAVSCWDDWKGRSNGASESVTIAWLPGPDGFDARAHGAIMVAEPREEMSRRCSAPGVGIPFRPHSLITRVNDLDLRAGTDERQVARKPGNSRTCTAKNRHRPGYEEGRTAALSWRGIGPTFGPRFPGTSGNRTGRRGLKGRERAEQRRPAGLAWDTKGRGLERRLVSDSSFDGHGCFFSLQPKGFLSPAWNHGSDAVANRGSLV